MKSTVSTWLAALLSGIAAIGFLVTCSGHAAAEDDSGLEDLYFIEQAANRIRARLVVLRKAPDANSEEVAEHERYLERLEAQISARRQALKALKAGPMGRHSAKPRSIVPPVGAPPKIPVVTETTETDDVVALDKELHTSLGRFDEMLLQEVETATEESVAGGSAGTGGGDRGTGSAATAATSGTGSASGGLPGPTQRGSHTSSEGTSSGGTRDQRQTTQAGVGARVLESGSGGKSKPGDASGSQGAVPSDIPDGRDDDVVARQIREAAEAETDPALREKLWDEYRRYKRGSS